MFVHTKLLVKKLEKRIMYTLSPELVVVTLHVDSVHNPLDLDPIMLSCTVWICAHMYTVLQCFFVELFVLAPTLL